MIFIGLGSAQYDSMVLIGKLPMNPAALATPAGVLTEVPVMLALVKVANSTK